MNKNKGRQMTLKETRIAHLTRNWVFAGASKEENALAGRVKEAIDNANYLLQSKDLTTKEKKDLRAVLKPVDDHAAVGPIVRDSDKKNLIRLEGSILLLKEEHKISTESSKRRGSVAAYQPHPKKQCVLKL